MLGLLLRRVVWLLPLALLGSIVAFLLFSLPTLPSSPPAIAGQRPEDSKRATFEDLPRFFNPNAPDLRDRARAAAAALDADDPAARSRARAELRHLGAAAFATLFADGPPSTEVGLALAPVAARMGLPRAEEAADPALTTEFWRRVWEARAEEFASTQAKTTVARLLRYGTLDRLSEATVKDTLVLAEIERALDVPDDETEIARTRLLIEAAARIAERDDRVGADASLAEARACALRWRRYFWLYGSDFEQRDGATKALRAVTETRYAKWVLGEIVATDEPGTATQRRSLGVWLLTSFSSAVAGASIAALVSLAVRRASADRVGELRAGPTALLGVVVALGLQRLTGRVDLAIPLGVGVAGVRGAGDIDRGTLPRAFALTMLLEVLLHRPGLGLAFADAVSREDARLLTLAGVLALSVASLALALSASIAAWSAAQTPRVLGLCAAGLAGQVPVWLVGLEAPLPPTSAPLPELHAWGVGVAALVAIGAGTLGVALGAGAALASVRVHRRRRGLAARALSLAETVPIAFVALVMAKLTGPVWALAGATALSLGVVAANALGDTIERTRDDEIALASRAVGATEVAILRRHVWPTFQLVLPFVPAAALTTVFVVDGVQAEVVTPGSGLGAWAVGGPAPGLVALASAGLLWAAGRVSATRLGRRRARLLDPLAFERRMR
jgi:hypothetical protein